MWEFIRKAWERIMSDEGYYHEGYDAFHMGFIPIDNPYHEGTYAHSEWIMGWEVANGVKVHYIPRRF